MFRELFVWVLSSFSHCFNLAKAFILDSALGITFYHFLLFTIFIRIVFLLVNFIKHVQEVEDEKTKEFERSEKQQYENWLRSNAVRRSR